MGGLSYEIWKITSEDTFLPQEYEDTRLQVMGAYGTAIDRLMGEMMSKHNYTESEFKEILGEYFDVMLYDKIQRYLPNS